MKKHHIRPRKDRDHKNCNLIKEGLYTGISFEMPYFIYQDKHGKIHGETKCSTFDIADSLDEYQKMTNEEIESLAYNSEMTIAR